jgi:hypothetical protein
LDWLKITPNLRITRNSRKGKLKNMGLEKINSSFSSLPPL